MNSEEKRIEFERINLHDLALFIKSGHGMINETITTGPNAYETAQKVLERQFDAHIKKFVPDEGDDDYETFTGLQVETKDLYFELGFLAGAELMLLFLK